MLSNFQQSRAVVAQAVFAPDTVLRVRENDFLLIRQQNRDLSVPALCQLTIGDARPQRTAANCCLHLSVSTSCSMCAVEVVLHVAERSVPHPDC